MRSEEKKNNHEILQFTLLVGSQNIQFVKQLATVSTAAVHTSQQSERRNLK